MTPEEREYVQRGVGRTKRTTVTTHPDEDVSFTWPSPDDSGWLELHLSATGTATIRETPEEPMIPGESLKGQAALDLLLAVAAGAFIDQDAASRILRTVFELKRAKGTPEEVAGQRAVAAFNMLAHVVESHRVDRR